MAALEGTLITETFGYDGGRQVTAYVPPDPSDSIVFCGDGQSTPRWATVLEASGRRSTMIVGAHSTALEDARLGEYSPIFDAKVFAAHEEFFVDDVGAWVQSHFGVALASDRTAVFGCSGAGELALAVGLRHPDLYGAIFCASPGGGYRPNGELPAGITGIDPLPDRVTALAGRSLPRTYLVGGKQEQWFLDHAIRWADALRDAGGEVVLMERQGEHGGAFWQEELPLMVAWAFGP